MYAYVFIIEQYTTLVIRLDSGSHECIVLHNKVSRLSATLFDKLLDIHVILFEFVSKWQYIVIIHLEKLIRTTLFMIFRVTYNICKGPKLDAWKSQTVMFTNSKYDTICQHKQLFKDKICLQFVI